MSGKFEKYIDIIKSRKNYEKIRPFILKVLSEIERDWNNKSFFIIEAPTGYGKSTISMIMSLYTLHEEFKSIIVFPTRILLEGQYKDFLTLFDKGGEMIVGKRYMHNPDSRYLIKPITLTTVDTFSLNLFGISPEDLENIIYERSYGHYFFSIFSTLFSNIILDEVHLLADSTKSLSFLIALMKIAEKFNQKIIFMSATIPKILEENIKKIFSDKIKFIRFSSEDDSDFCKNRTSKEYEIHLLEFSKNDKYSKIKKIIEENKNKYSKILVIFNTVREAIEFYDFLKGKVDFNVFLLHSRFTEKDKNKKIEEIINLRNENKYIVISTQAIEVGVNISSNLLITDIAPPNSLIQRFGRFLRFEEEMEGKIYIWYEKEILEDQEDEIYKVYNKSLVKKTLKYLKELLEDQKVKLNVHLSFSKDDKIGYQQFLDRIYDDDEIIRIDEEQIKKLEFIMFNIEKIPEKALEILFESGGSFVRDSNQIPVVTKDILSEIKKDISLNLFIEEFVVTIPVELFLKLIEDEKVLGFCTYDEETNSLKIINVDRKHMSKFKRNIDILKETIRKRIIAYIIEAEYSSEVGLKI